MDHINHRLSNSHPVFAHDRVSSFFAILVAILSCCEQGCSSGDPEQAPSERQAFDPVKGNATTVSPLLAAVGGGNEALVRRLLESGAVPDQPTSARSTLIQAITSFGPGARPTFACNQPIVKLLLDHGADPNRPDPVLNSLPLLTAFDIGDVECARLIRAAGGKPDGREKGGRTLLMAATGAAARRHDTAILNIAISWGSGPNDQDQQGSTALHQAVMDNSADVAKALLERGADPCLRNSISQTPLDMAINLSRSRPLIEVLQAVKCAPITNPAANP
jgi:ankyrin repeat protein